MSKAAVVAVICWGIVIALVLYGLSFDLRRFLARVYDRACQRDRRVHVAECVQRERLRSGVAWLEAWYADQLDEIRGLPTADDPRRLI